MKSSRVGAKKLPAYKDPEASLERIRRLPKKRQIQHPNLPLEEALRLVNEDPGLFPLLLENPAAQLWDLMEPGWIRRLSGKVRREVASNPSKPYLDALNLKLNRAKHAFCPSLPKYASDDLYSAADYAAQSAANATPYNGDYAARFAADSRFGPKGSRAKCDYLKSRLDLAMKLSKLSKPEAREEAAQLLAKLLP